MEALKILRRATQFCSASRSISVINVFSVRSFSSLNYKNVAKNEILPVLIVGAGPVGLFLSALLAQLGVHCVVLEKNSTFSEHPRAHFINNRTMEVFRTLNGLAEEILKLQPPIDLWRKFIYCTSLSGSIIGSVDHMLPQDFDKVVSPVSVAHFSQHKLTRLLLKQLKNLGFCVSNGDELVKEHDHGFLSEKMIMMGHECTSIEATDHGILASASYLMDGKKMERKIRCRILVGSDGAASVMRRLVGINMKGEKDLQKLISIHFSSRELGQYLLNERPGMLFFIFNVEAIGILVAHDLKQGEFVLQMPFYPPQQSVEDFNSEVCKEIISKLAGCNFMDIDVLDIKPWVMHAEVAEKFISCNDRVILAGDAAHRFPPAGGFGMNTGIQDAHNLAWKIASMVKGISPPSILRTYETERLPIAHFNTALSVQNFKAAMSVPAALGLDPTIANSIHKVINGVIGSVLPSGLQRTILHGIFSIGRAQASESFLNERNPIGSSRLARLRRIFDEGKSLQLQFPAEDLGFRYREGALVPDGDSTLDAKEVPTGRRRNYIPSSEPGSRLPHMNVTALEASLTKETFSTLELVRGDRIEFLLIISPTRDSYSLARAAFEVAGKFRVSLRVCIMWPCSSTVTSGVSKAVLVPWTNYIDVQEVKNPSSSSWWEVCKMTENGAILVRPDEHIAWQAKSTVTGDPVLEMQRVFSQVLGVEEDHP